MAYDLPAGYRVDDWGHPRGPGGRTIASQHLGDGIYDEAHIRRLAGEFIEADIRRLTRQLASLATTETLDILRRDCED